jgi:hypothetical protein
MRSFAETSESWLWRYLSTAATIGAKFRCMSSMPADSDLSRLKFFVCLAKSGSKSPLNAMLSHTKTL